MRKKHIIQVLALLTSISTLSFASEKIESPKVLKEQLVLTIQLKLEKLNEEKINFKELDSTIKNIENESKINKNYDSSFLKDFKGPRTKCEEEIIKYSEILYNLTELERNFDSNLKKFENSKNDYNNFLKYVSSVIKSPETIKEIKIDEEIKIEKTDSIKELFLEKNGNFKNKKDIESKSKIYLKEIDKEYIKKNIDKDSFGRIEELEMLLNSGILTFDQKKEATQELTFLNEMIADINPDFNYRVKNFIDGFKYNNQSINEEIAKKILKDFFTIVDKNEKFDEEFLLNKNSDFKNMSNLTHEAGDHLKKVYKAFNDPKESLIKEKEEWEKTRDANITTNDEKIIYTSMIDDLNNQIGNTTPSFDYILDHFVENFIYNGKSINKEVAILILRECLMMEEDEEEDNIIE